MLKQVKLVMGDKIPADGILFMSSAYSDMQCDESSLTGEAETVKKNAENSPMLYSGCLIAEGQGHMVVTSVSCECIHFIYVSRATN